MVFNRCKTAAMVVFNFLSGKVKVLIWVFKTRNRSIKMVDLGLWRGEMKKPIINLMIGDDSDDPDRTAVDLEMVIDTPVGVSICTYIMHSVLPYNAYLYKPLKHDCCTAG